MTQKMIFSQKVVGIKNVGFYANFRSVNKTAKKPAAEKIKGQKP